MKIPVDKQIHFSVCALVSLGAMLIFRSLTSPLSVACIAAALIGISLGLGKEYGDHASPSNKWDWWDFLADVLGAFAGTGLGTIFFFI